MIGTIRKHSKWLLWLIAGTTIASFVLFMGSGPARSGGGGSTVSTNLGTIYGEKITPQEYLRVENSVNLYYLFNYGQWPRQNPNVTEDSLKEEIYVRLMMLRKAKELGIHVSDEQVATAAANILRSPQLLRTLGVHDQSVPLTSLVNQVLAPQGLGVTDFENFVRDDLMIEQLRMTFGLPGQLITPQEAANQYVMRNQEYSAEVVFFSASNYLAEASVSAEDVGLFYTNYMADYRLPERRQVNYVVFSVTNYLKEAEQKLMKTNLDDQVTYLIKKYGQQIAPEAKTLDEAKVHVREVLIRQQALADAGNDANSFAQTVYNLSGNQNRAASPQDIDVAAQKQGLTVQTTAPFSADYGPEEFVAPEVFTRTAFELTPDSPIPEPLEGPNGVYVMGLMQIYPTEIPPLEQIHGQVAHDLELREATFMAMREGTNFVRTLNIEMASGKSFAAACIAAGVQPQVLPPFSFDTSELPGLGAQATLNQIKQTVLTTPVGSASGFQQTEDGGFVMYVESRLPIDRSKMMADLSQFTSQLREEGSQEAFQEWFRREANSELRDTPLPRADGMR